jgi:cytochrome b561
MQLKNSPTGYGAVPQALHWVTAICVMVGWLLGQFNDAFPKGPPRALALWTHMTLGELVVLFLVARLVWRFTNPPPPLEPTQFGRLLESRRG